MPSEVDRSVFPKKSGSLISALSGGFEFLGATDSRGMTTPVLHELVDAVDTDEWEDVLRGVLMDSYAPIINGLNLVSGTSRQLETAFDQTAISGSTKRKAIRFFLSALTDAGVKHSPHFKPPKTERRKKSKPSKPQDDNKRPKSPPVPERPKDKGDEPEPSGGRKPHNPFVPSGSTPDGYQKLEVPVPGREHPYTLIMPSNTTTAEWSFVQRFVGDWHEFKESKEKPDQGDESPDPV